MFFMSFNTDFGDAYEREGDDPSYLQVLSTWLRRRHVILYDDNHWKQFLLLRPYAQDELPAMRPG